MSNWICPHFHVTQVLVTESSSDKYVRIDCSAGSDLKNNKLYIPGSVSSCTFLRTQAKNNKCIEMKKYMAVQKNLACQQLISVGLVTTLFISFGNKEVLPDYVVIYHL